MKIAAVFWLQARKDGIRKEPKRDHLVSNSSISRRILGNELHIASFDSKTTSFFAKGDFKRLSCRVATGLGWAAGLSGETRNGRTVLQMEEC